MNRSPFSMSFGYSPIKAGTYETTQHFNTNQETVSPEYEKMVPITHAVNPQSNTSERTSTEVHENDSMVESLLSSAQEDKTFVCELGETKFRNKNSLMTHKTTRSAKKKSKDNLSENKFKMQYSQSQLNVIQTIERPYERDQFTIDINEPTTSYGIKYIGERFPQINTNPCAAHPGYFPMQSYIYEKNQDFYSNQLSASSENKQMEFTTRGMHPQTTSNQRAVREAYNSFLESASSSPHMRTNIMNQNLEKYSKDNRKKLKTVRQSTVVDGDSKHTNTEHVDQCGANIPNIPQNEIEARNKNSASNLSLKHHYNVQSEGRLKRPEIWRWLLTSENNQIRQHHNDENTHGCGSGENRFGDISNSTRQSCPGKGNDSNDLS
ncbi:zinc finger protein [Trichonephila clavata]|uniref:Zinc finger protein n=1 Tax=Trichonephila clavata TaxID=2740835 RepID=A0A8X6LCF4_TRICU|nr:zinc finger protein [Trichonephila clavata]